jgi:hypothetical protein
MSKRGIRRIAVAAAVAILPVVSASVPVSAAKGDGNGPDVNEQPVAKLKKGGTFIWAINNIPDTSTPVTSMETLLTRVTSWARLCQDSSLLIRLVHS